MGNKEQEQALARAALALMAEHDIPPTPENYELFHAFAGGGNRGLSRVLGDLIAAKRPLTAQVLRELRERSLPRRNVSDDGDALGAAGRALKDLSEAAAATRRDAADYGGALSHAHGAFEKCRTPEQFEELLQSLRIASGAMAARARGFEDVIRSAIPMIAEYASDLQAIRRERTEATLAAPRSGDNPEAEIEHAIKEAHAEDDVLSLIVLRSTHRESLPNAIREQADQLIARYLSRDVAGVRLNRLDAGKFALLCAHAALDEALALAGKLQADLNAMVLIRKSSGERLGRITLAMGVAQYAEGETGRDLVQRAEACLALASRLGRNSVIAESDPRFANADIDAA